MKHDTNLAIITGSNNFPPLTSDSRSFKDLIERNLKGMLDDFSFDIAKVPAGGGITWEVSSLDGLETAQHLEGVIVYWDLQRRLWRQKYSGEATLPDCSSDDAVTGHGNPGGACAPCLYAQWGSADDGRGQACRLIARVFLLRPDAMLPVQINLPPSSLENFRRYLRQLTSAGVMYCSVVTRLTLEKTKNLAGVVYSQVVPSRLSSLTQEQVAKIQEYITAIETAIIGTSPRHRDENDLP